MMGFNSVTPKAPGRKRMVRFRLKLTNYGPVIKKIHFPADRSVFILDLPAPIWYLAHLLCLDPQGDKEETVEKRTQLSVILANTPGELSKLCDVLKASDINILAMSIQNAEDSVKARYKMRE